MSDLIKHESGFISKEEVDKILNFARNNPDDFTEYGNSEEQFKVSLLSKGDNVAEVRALLLEHDKKVYEYLKSNYEFKFKPYQTAIHIARFEEGSGMHVHFDSSRPDDIATIIYLNDDYEGGEIYFPDYNKTIKPKAGDLVAFPDNENFRHGVNEVVGTTRYTTPRWFTTEGTKE